VALPVIEIIDIANPYNILSEQALEQRKQWRDAKFTVKGPKGSCSAQRLRFPTRYKADLLSPT
jgi:hypothetical protein